MYTHIYVYNHSLYVQAYIIKLKKPIIARGLKHVLSVSMKKILKFRKELHKVVRLGLTSISTESSRSTVQE